MSERFKIGWMILMILAFFIVPVMHMKQVAWYGQLGCVGVSFLLMFIAFKLVKARTPDILLLIYGEVIQAVSVICWGLIGPRARIEKEIMDHVYTRSQDFTFNSDVVYYTLVGGVLLAILLYFYRNAVRYDLGLR